MAARIEVVGNAGRAIFEAVPLGAKRSRRRVAVDAQGRECQAALMTRDGVCLPGGAVAVGYQDAGGNDADRTGLVACGAAGHALPRRRAREGGALELGEAVDAAELLEFVIERIDLLSPVDIDEGLKRSLDSGSIHRVAAHQPAFLLATAAGTFLLRATPAAWDFVSPAQAHMPDDAWDDDPAADDEEDWEEREW